MVPSNQSIPSSQKWAKGRFAVPAFLERVPQRVMPKEGQPAYFFEQSAFPARLASLELSFHRK